MSYLSDKLFSHLTLNCDLGPNHLVFAHRTLPHEGEHLCQVLLNSCNKWKSYGQDKLFYHIWPWTVTLNLARWFWCTGLLRWQRTLCSGQINTPPAVHHGWSHNTSRLWQAYKNLTYICAAVFTLVLNDLLGHSKVQGNSKLLIIVCVITVNRYSDNNVHPCILKLQEQNLA